MEASRMFLESTVQPCINELFSYLLPDQEFKSIHDLFNAQKFHKLLSSILIEDTKHKIHDMRLIQDSDNQTYNEMRCKHFRKITKIIEQASHIGDVTLRHHITDKDVDRMIENSDMRVLEMYLENVFDLIPNNNPLLEYLSTVSEAIQQKFYQVMNKSIRANQISEADPFHEENHSSFLQLKVVSKIASNQLGSHDLTHLQEMQIRFQQLQESLLTKQEQVKSLKEIMKQSNQELEQTKNQLLARNEQIEMLKKRLDSFIQFDNLVAEKDQEITKLTNKLTDQTLKARLKQSQLATENKNLQERLSQLESRQVEILAKFQKQKQHIELITRQKDQSEASMKKVINIYKDKYKSTNQKNEEIKKQMIELKFQKQKLQEELADLKSLQPEVKKQISSGVLDSLQSPRSPLKDDLNEQLGSVRGNYSKLAEQLSIDLDRADFEDEFGPLPRQNNKRFTELLQENYMLKQQLQKVQSSSFLDSKQYKDLQDEVQKMKKKINILKRRNDEIESQRKDEIDIMIGIMEQFSVSYSGVQGAKK